MMEPGVLILVTVLLPVVAAFLVALLVAQLVSRGAERHTAPPQEEEAPVASEGASSRLLAGLRFGFVEVFDHTMPWIALGLVIAAMAESMLSHGAIAEVPALLQVPVAALVGVPIYVCASGATPVAALAVHKGLSAGAASSPLACRRDATYCAMRVPAGAAIAGISTSDTSAPRNAVALRARNRRYRSLDTTLAALCARCASSTM